MCISGSVGIIERELIEVFLGQVMVTGDFNAHYEDWRNRKTGTRERVIA